MSESQNEDAERKERARRVAALAGASRQPGERARIGTRIAGSVAVLALVAGGTLGIGAWHSYRAETAAKEAKAEKDRKKREAELTKKPTASRSESEKKGGEERKEEKKMQELPTTPSESTKPTLEPPTETVEKPKKDVKLTAQSKTAKSGYSRVVLANGATKMCADLPYYGGHPDGAPITQYRCNTNDGDNQLWNITVSHPKAGPEGRNLVMLANVKDGRCFDLLGYGGKPNGTRLYTGICNSNKVDDNQQWWLEGLPNSTGKRLHNYASKGRCLQVDGGSDKKDARLVIGDCKARSATWFMKQ
ncbi:RICIN domain-containing protein [Streptomyces oryzae]|uniref:RICIN domain-containing protein n=1 Tax=Streptomyces oryzae TaxID=1434886 RepID=A0ABS3XJ70_9ACTN|nr:RICIN domain-containing protein [Streptomyces oryzae]MBO8195370.1 RICIN domain-containing protein [Streptomyces oryzae]